MLKRSVATILLILVGLLIGSTDLLADESDEKNVAILLDVGNLATGIYPFYRLDIGFEFQFAVNDFITISILPSGAVGFFGRSMFLGIAGGVILHPFSSRLQGLFIGVYPKVSFYVFDDFWGYATMGFGKAVSLKAGYQFLAGNFVVNLAGGIGYSASPYPVIDVMIGIAF